MVAVLLKHGFDVNWTDRLGRSLVTEVVCWKPLKMLLIASTNSVGRNIVDAYGNTLLSLAARCGNIEVVDYMLEHSLANVSIVDKFGRSALWWAQRQGDTHMIEALTKAVATQNVTESSQGVPYNKAAEIWHELRNQAVCDVCVKDIYDAPMYI